ncbi:MAG: transglycosylase SLT domain-containing protein, partial [Bacteroidales bacterium]|nr:transglycosylase SLT domain-containing protein [Bacteroidales bacterium]
ISLSEINLANNLKKYYQNFTIDSSLNFSITSCWIVDSKSEILLDSINSWYKNYQQTKQYKNKNDYLTQYFQKINLRNNYFSQFGKNISQFDEIIKKHCQNWDWRFISALIYEESRFNPNAKNKTSGAFGLMQLLPYNYDLYAFDTSLNVASQIKAGIGLLNTINQQLKTEIPDSLSRIKLSLAAYNIGLSHIEDAIRLSEKFSTTDTYSWNTLSYFLENLSNPDYYNDSVVLRGKCNAVVGVVFANRIYNRYLNYKNLIE